MSTPSHPRSRPPLKSRWSTLRADCGLGRLIVPNAAKVAPGWRLLDRWCGRAPSCGCGFGLLLLLAPSALGREAHLDLTVGDVDKDCVTGAVLEAQELLAERVLDHALDHAAQRPRSIDLVESFGHDLFLGAFGDGERQLLCGEMLRDFGEHEVDDRLHLLVRQ